MIWRFTILDRNNIATVIDEPVGWDSNESEIKRDPDTHGIFFNNHGDAFEFYGEARSLIKAEYDQYRAKGDMTLILEEDCGNGFEEFTRGKFNFLKYDHQSGGGKPFVKIPVENIDEVMELRNRYNQKVNLETVKAYDEVTDLPAYNKLGFEQLLPSKGILLKNDAENDILNKTPVGANITATDPFISTVFGVIEIGMNKTVTAEIGGFNFEPQPKYTIVESALSTPGGHSIELIPGVSTYIYPDYYSPTENFAKEFPNVTEIGSADINLALLIEGKIKAVNADLNNISLILLKRASVIVPPATSATEVYTELFKEVFYANATVNFTKGTELAFSKAFNTVLNLTDGDRLYLLFTVDIPTDDFPHRHIVTLPPLLNPIFIDNAFEIEFNPGNYFRMNTLSHTPATASKIFMINESISRVVEGITNNKVKAYSNYYGRTDSQPYNQPFDGCGSLKAITDGIRIRRQENKIAGQTNLYSVSLQDLYEFLNPIDNIGMGIEKDTNRPGFNRLRVEPWNFFYKMEVVMRCIGVNKISRKAYEKEIFSTFQFGYNRWEAEEYNGLDEFLTKRIYRTTLSQVKNDLIKLSRAIASGYAIEITRRKGNTDSKDWRYDKETFIICLRRGGLSYSTPAAFFSSSNSFNIITDNPSFFVAGDQYKISNTGSNNNDFTIDHITPIGNSLQIFLTGNPVVTENAAAPLFTNITPNKLSVEMGNVSNPENIIDPDTLYNYRISPLRNAMRWMNRVLESYGQFDADAKIIFTDGDANYFAKGEMTDTTCKPEAGPVAENDTIDITIYQDSDQAKPFLLPERVNYEFPMSSKEYKHLQENPYGLIYFEGDCDEGYGFIDTIICKHEDGLATFNLIPAIVDEAALRRHIITQDGFDIVNQDGKYWITQ